MRRSSHWSVLAGSVLACLTAVGCGSAAPQVDDVAAGGGGVRTAITAPAGTEYALLPTTGVQDLRGTPTSWTAASSFGGLGLSIDTLPTGPVPMGEGGRYLRVEPPAGLPGEQQQERAEILGESLLAVPVSAWEEVVAAPDERKAVDEATFTLGPLGSVTRTIEGSLAEGFRYSLTAELSDWGSPVCATCDGPIRFGFSEAIGDRFVSVYRIPSDLSGPEIDLPSWAVDDALVSETLLLVELEREGDEGSISWVDEDGERQRHDLGVHLG